MSLVPRERHNGFLFSSTHQRKHTDSEFVSLEDLEDQTVIDNGFRLVLPLQFKCSQIIMIEIC